MGVMKRGWPRWFADHIPDAPSIALRIFSVATPGEVPLERRPGADLDLLCTAGGDRLWKLVLNLSTGGFMYGLEKFDYLSNLYYAQVPYRSDDGFLDVWIRLVPYVEDSSLKDPALQGVDTTTREARLTKAVTVHTPVRIEMQRTGSRREPFVPIAELRLQSEIQIDQEALHFDPIEGRGFVPHGALTVLRRSVYPASVQGRPSSHDEREHREHESIIKRLSRFFAR
jgi:hypothetical protein